MVVIEKQESMSRANSRFNLLAPMKKKYNKGKYLAIIANSNDFSITITNNPPAGVVRRIVKL